MTIKLLVSVTNVQEALVALDADVDIIDLKDPSIGALGALPLNVIKAIVQAVNKRAIVSATVGEGHEGIAGLLMAVKQTSALGVDIIKVAISSEIMDNILGNADFSDTLKKLNHVNCKVVAVLFADKSHELMSLGQFSQIGFFGVMLDTSSKDGKNLLDHQSIAELQSFVALCEQFKLMSGLAGSLRLKHVSNLLDIKPSYIGFRGGVCLDDDRKSTLDKSRIVEVLSVVKKQQNKVVTALDMTDSVA